MREDLIKRMKKIYKEDNPIIAQFTKICKDFPDTPSYNNALEILVESHEEYVQKEPQ